MCLRSRTLLLTLLAAVLFAPAARAQPQGFGPAYGQGPGGGFNPNFSSPYSTLNLLQGRNANAGTAYAGIVRPQSQFNSAIQGLQRGGGAFNPFIQADMNPDAPFFTGSVFGFQNHLNYFQNQYALGSFGVSGFGGRNGGRFGGGTGNMGTGGTNLNPGGVAAPKTR
jgi:hypothetical protein